MTTPHPAPLPTLTAEKPAGWYECRYRQDDAIGVLSWDGIALSLHEGSVVLDITDYTDFVPLVPASDLAAVRSQLAEAMAKRANLMRCYECGGLFKIAELHPASAHPEASPICGKCMDLAAARDEIARLKAGAATAKTAVRCCPQCGGAIQRVTNTGGWMNPDQFDAVKAGDWYCESCPDNGRGASGLCYWFDTELAADRPEQQARLAAMQTDPQPQPIGEAAKG